MKRKWTKIALITTLLLIVVAGCSWLLLKYIKDKPVASGNPTPQAVAQWGRCVFSMPYPSVNVVINRDEIPTVIPKDTLIVLTDDSYKEFEVDGKVFKFNGFKSRFGNNYNIGGLAEDNLVDFKTGCTTKALFINKDISKNNRTTLFHEFGHLVQSKDGTRKRFNEYPAIRGIQPFSGSVTIEEWNRNDQEDFAEVFKYIYTGEPVRTIYGQPSQEVINYVKSLK